MKLDEIGPNWVQDAQRLNAGSEDTPEETLSFHLRGDSNH